MIKVVSAIPKWRFDRFQIQIPPTWQTTFIEEGYSQTQLVEACSGADYLLVGSAGHPVLAEAINAFSSIKMIHVEGVGFNEVDIVAAAKRGIPVCNNRAVNNGAVAEHTIGLILAALRRTCVVDHKIKQKQYETCKNEFSKQGEHELAGLHVGLVGIGAIGREVVKRLSNWGCKISYYDAFPLSPEEEEKLQVNYMELEELFKTCDIISLHVPATSSTYGMISQKQLSQMKPSAILVNTARGELVDQAALAHALESNEISAAALDTIYPEPPSENHPLLSLSSKASNKLILTPHIGGVTDEAFRRMLQGTVQNVQRMEAGDLPINIVNS